MRHEAASKALDRAAVFTLPTAPHWAMTQCPDKAGSPDVLRQRKTTSGSSISIWVFYGSFGFFRMELEQR
jgi:hypothetical protein